MAGEEILVFIDDLTKIYNRRFLHKELHQRMEERDAKSGEFSIILMDIDHFKIINDSFGHLAGDEALQLFSSFLKDYIRKDDIICRYAGDEFVIILPHTNAMQSSECGLRIVELLKKKEFSLTRAGTRVKLSASMGLASYPEDAKDEDTLFKIADKGLYEAKRGGGNRIERHNEVVTVEKVIDLNLEKFIGRYDILSLFKSSLESALSGKSKVLLVRGMLGVGKTRLLSEASQYATLLGFETFSAKAIAQKIAPPYSLWSSLIRSIKEGSKDKTIMNNVVQALSRMGEIFKWFISGVVVGPDDANRNLPYESVEGRKQLLFETVLRFFSKLSESFPIFLILDDLQWVEEDDIQMLAYVIRNLSGSRVLIGAAYRESEIEGQKHPLKKVILALSREALVDKIDIGPMIRSEVRELTGAVLGLLNVPEDVVDFLNEITDGNPLFIIEILKMLVEKGHIYRTAGAWNFFKLEEVVLPERVSDMLREKIELLSSESRKLLMTASVIGQSFSVENLRFLTGGNEGYLIDLLDEAIEKGIIVERKGEIGEYRFLYRMMQKVFYELQSVGMRALTHRKIGEMLELVHKDPEEWIEDLAYHFRNAGMDEKAFSYYHLCAQKAEEMMVYQKAIGFYSEMLKIGRNIENSVISNFELYYRLGYLYKRIGKLSLAEEFFNDSLEIPEIDGNDKAKVLHRMGNIYFRRGKFNDAIKYYKKAKEVLLDQSSVEAAMIGNDEAGVYLKKGMYTKAFEIAQKAVAMLSTEHSKEKSYLLNTIGEINFYWGKMDEALSSYNRTLVLAKKCGLENQVALVYKNIGRVYLEQGKISDAERFLKMALFSCEKTGDFYLEAMIYNDLGIVFTFFDSGKARDYYLRSLNISKKIGDEDGVAAIFNNIGALYQREIELEKAMRMFEEALRIWENLGKRQATIIPYLNIGEIYFNQNNFEKALYYFFKAKEKSNEIKYINGEISALFELSTLFLEQGKEEAVGDLVEEAWELNKIYKSKDYTAHAKLLRAQLAFDEDIEESERLYDDITENLNQIEDRSLEKDIEVFGGRLQGRLGRFQEALKYFERAETLCERTGDRLGLVSTLFCKAVVLKRKGENKRALNILQKIRSMLEETNAILWMDKVEGLIKDIQKQ